MYASNANLPFKKRKGSVATVPQVRKMIAAAEEMKHHLHTQAAQNLPNTGFTSTVLTGITQGNGVTQRIGGEVNVKAVEINLVTTLGDATNIVRFILLKARNWGTTAPTSNEVVSYASTGYGFMGTVDPFDKKAEFTVLYDSGPLPLSSSVPDRTIKIRLKKKWKIYFNSSSTTDQKNGLYLYGWSDSVAATHPVVTFVSNVSYTDA